MSTIAGMAFSPAYCAKAEPKPAGKTMVTSHTYQWLRDPSPDWIESIHPPRLSGGGWWPVVACHAR
jgi:hypothetical protein